MDWGHPHSEATFPEREKRKVALFDVKSFVKEKKRQNMLNSLDGKGPNPSDNPFGGGANPFANANPFGGGVNPFGGANPFASAPNPFAPQPNNNSNSGMFGGLGGGLDLDAMIKDIDRKIAELDAEEAKQKEELARKKAEEKAATNLESKVVEPVGKMESLPSLEDTLTDFKSTPIKEAKIEEPTVEKLANDEVPQFNIFNQQPEMKKEDVESKSNSSISIGNGLSNIAVATSSPAEDIDMSFSDLPKVEEPTIIQPKSSGSKIVKPNQKIEYNIYNTMPNIMNEIKEDKTKEAKEEKANVNIDPDKIVIDNSIISDDEFFDDFFSDD